MTRSDKAVFAVYSTHLSLARCLDDLRAAGVQSRNVSVLFPEDVNWTEFPGLARDLRPSGSEPSGASARFLIGEALGWLVGVVSVVLPGGSYIAAGPLTSELEMVLAGAEPRKDIRHALIASGLHEEDAGRYERRVKAGDILVSVHSQDASDVRRAYVIIQATGAQEVSLVGISNPDRDVTRQ